MSSGRPTGRGDDGQATPDRREGPKVSAGNEMSRLLRVDPLADGGLEFAVAASPQELAALARRLDLMALGSLTAEGRIVPGPLQGSILVEGRLSAAATQTCVATLEPVPEQVEAEFRRLFVPGDDGDDGTSEIEIDPHGDLPEPLAGPMLDIGEIVAEELALSLDPYPRAPGAEELPAAPPDAANGPFAVLAHRRSH
jgi:uncharacterized metal-binding protein YceD (DUF177 family)